MTKRLFIFAGYDINGIVDASLLHYLHSLSALGDIVFTMDCDATVAELNKVKKIKNVLYAVAERHNEYDFGSYKRGYSWAKKQKILNKYDWVYFVNDSVYGPLFDLKPILEDLESRKVDLTGMTDFENEATPIQVQSWFVGVSKRVANSKFLSDFLNTVKHQDIKQLVVLKYEVGLSQLIVSHGFKLSTYVSGENGAVCHTVYEKPIEILKKGVPFVKKNGLCNLLGLQYLYPYTSDEMVEYIYENAIRNKIPFIKQSGAVEYENCFRLTLLSLPIFKIMCQKPKNATWISYKMFLFDCIPVFKISITKR